MQFSEQLDKIAPALLRVQQTIAPVAKDGENPHFHSQFATLDSVTEYVRPILAAEGLVLVQGGGETTRQGGINVETMLMHTSGQWVKSSIDMPLQKADPQGAGSAVTYGRRYGLMALLAIAHETDDDGEGAVRRMRSTAEQIGGAPPRQYQPQRNPPAQQQRQASPSDSPACPKCGSDMWDNRPKKRSGEFSARSPDFKCKDKECGEVIWPDRGQKKKEEGPPRDDAPPPWETEDFGFDEKLGF